MTTSWPSLLNSNSNAVLMNMAAYLPSLVKFCDSSFRWDLYNDIFNEELARRYEELEKLSAQSGVPIDSLSIPAVSIYDCIVAARKGNKSAEGFLFFVNNMFNNLSRNLNPDEKLLVHKTIKALLKELTIDFLNYVGELGVLNNLMDTKQYRLLKVEEKMSNGKGLDFTLNNLHENKVYRVEVYNLRIDDEKVEANDELIKEFLEYRISCKFAKKNKKLIERVDYELLTVLWGNVNSIKTYSEYFQKNNIEIDNTHEPIAYLMRTDGNSFYATDFAVVGRLLPKIVGNNA